MKTSLSLLLPVLLAFTAFSQSPANQSETVLSNDSTYVNTFFKFKLSIPGGWTVQSEKQMKATSEIGKELIAGDNKSLKVALDVSEKRTGGLLVASELPIGAPVPSNAVLVVISEDIEPYPGIVSGADYLYHAKRLMS